MQTHTGETATRAIFENNHTILAFIFTKCSLVCPIMTPNLVAMAQTAPAAEIQFVLISVDPANDTPQNLADYARASNMDERFTLLAPPSRESLNEVMAAGLGFREAIDEVIQTPEGTIDNIRHPSRLLLVGPDVTIQGIARGTERSDAIRLVRQAARLAS